MTSSKIRPNNKQRWAVSTAAAVLVALAVWWLSFACSDDGYSEGGTQQAQHAGQLAKAAPQAQRMPDARARPSAPQESSTADADVVIQAVSVDKTSVCRGEEAVVDVRAVAGDGASEYLSYGVLGRGDLVGPRFSLQPHKSIAAGEMRVFARGRNGTTVLAPVPPLTVRDCDAPSSLRVKLERRAHAQDRAWLTAEVWAPSKEEDGVRDIVEYRWDFGDGKHAVTREPSVEHSYEGRAQDVLYSYFFVTVTARDALGEVARGTRSLRFVNLGFLPEATEGVVTLFSGGVADPKGDNWLYHGASQPVTLERVAVVDHAPDAEEEAPAWSDPGAVLGFTEILPGESKNLRSLAHLMPKDPATQRTLKIQGRTADGKRAEGAIILLADIDPPPASLATEAHNTQPE